MLCIASARSSSSNRCISLCTGIMVLVATSTIVSADPLPPLMLSPFQPEFSRKAFAPGEKSVTAEVTVDGQGQAAKVNVVEARGPKAYADAIVAGLQRATYMPALMDGQVVQDGVFEFTIAPPPFRPGAGGRRGDPFEEIREHINKGEYTQALRKLDEGGFEGDGALFLQAHAQFGTKNYERAALLLSKLERQGFPGNDKTAVTALTMMFHASLGSGRVGDAMHAFEALNKRQPLAADDPMQSVYRNLTAAVAKPEAYSVKGHLQDQLWWFRPARRVLAFTGVTNGALHEVGFLCANRTAFFAFQADVEFQVPESWGACEVYLRGDADTNFAVLEYPPAS
ncbi:MAG: hypothetical protein H6978_03580 [Gammaproteobacteria bacterium]|nr:hypothetical protein [Gammaproteobacteria bacterium]